MIKRQDLSLFLRCIVTGILILLCNDLYARKIYTSQYGKIYLLTGDSIIAEGESRVIVPKKRKRLEIIKNAYTNNNEIARFIEPQEVDSLVIMTPTAPENPHIFRYVKEYGWCYQAEHTPSVSLYCYSPKGYHCSGNGGIWMRGKSKMILVKDNRIYDFGNPEKWMDKKIREQLLTIFTDDSRLCDYIRSAKGRRDKILRHLISYNK